jgi:hypothetical protein
VGLLVFEKKCVFWHGGTMSHPTNQG